MRYRNVDLELAREGERFRLTLRGAAAPVDMRVEPFAADFDADLARLAEGDGDEAYFRDFGVRLYRALFPDPASRMLVRAIDHQRLRDGGVCIRLRLQDAAARALPWEFLFRPDWRRYLAASVESPLVRYLDVPRPIAELKVRPPLRVLVVAPESARHSPAGALDAGREIAGLREAIAALGGMASLDVLEEDVRFERLRDALIGTRYHVLHFIGHGRFDGGEARLVFDRAGGGEEGVREARLAELLVNHPSIKLAFLNACESAAVGNTESVHGMAPRLVEAGVPAVVAMQYQVRDDAAIAFSRVFYRSLFQGADRGRVDVAMSHARSALVGDYGDQREFGAPVLYLRAPAGLLFDAETAEDARKRVIRGDEIGRAMALEQTLSANVALGATEDDSALFHLRQAFVRSNRARACLVLVLFAALLVPGLTERLQYSLDTRIVELRDWLWPVPWHPDLRIVAIDEATEKALGKPLRGSDVDARSEYARLIDRLTEARARIIAFNFNLAVDKPSDATLVEAIERARTQGTAVVLAPRNRGAGADGTTLKRAFVDAGARWGSSCVQIDLHDRLTSIPLAASPRDRAGPALPAFALAAAYPGWVIDSIDMDAQELLLVGSTSPGAAPTRQVLKFSAEGRALGGDGCTLIPRNSRTADLLIQFPPTLDHSSSRLNALESIVRSATFDKRSFQGALVIVGNRFRTNPGLPDQEVKRLFKDEAWPMLDVIAAATNTVLRGAGMRRMFVYEQVLAVVSAFSLALLLGLRRPEGTLMGSARNSGTEQLLRQVARWLLTFPAWLALMVGIAVVVMIGWNVYFAVWYTTLAIWLGQEAGAYLAVFWLSGSKAPGGERGESDA